MSQMLDTVIEAITINRSVPVSRICPGFTVENKKLISNSVISHLKFPYVKTYLSWPLYLVLIYKSLKSVKPHFFRY